MLRITITVDVHRKSMDLECLGTGGGAMGRRAEVKLEKSHRAHDNGRIMHCRSCQITFIDNADRLLRTIQRFHSFACSTW